MITSFSKTTFCIELLKKTSHQLIMKSSANLKLILLIIFAQYKMTFSIFQNISKANLKPRRFIHIGDDFTYEENSKSININVTPDAIYQKNNDTLLFSKPIKIKENI